MKLLSVSSSFEGFFWSLFLSCWIQLFLERKHRRSPRPLASLTSSFITVHTDPHHRSDLDESSTPDWTFSTTTDWFRWTVILSTRVRWMCVWVRSEQELQNYSPTCPSLYCQYCSGVGSGVRGLNMWTHTHKTQQMWLVLKGGDVNVGRLKRWKVGLVNTQHGPACM